MYYYDVREDLEKYPDCWIYIIVGGRNTGKTYSGLRYCREEGIKQVFVKRTQEDVKLLCAGGGANKKAFFDVSPYKSLNRDFGWNIGAAEIYKGIGGFYERNEDNECQGAPIGYIVALSAVQKVKGFDLSDADVIIFDEFIPQPWEKINKKEGEMTMDLYKTVSRDREHRGKPPLKMLCFANATKLSNPLCNVLEITDIISQMDATGQSVMHLEDRGILIHMLNDNAKFRQRESESAIMKAMAGTAWGQMALENTFAYDDTSNVSKINLKKMRPKFKLIYKDNPYWCYYNDGQYYICDSASNKKDLPEYDLKFENDQKRFYYDRIITLKERCMNNKVIFQHYSIYDLIINYKKFFNV